MASDFPQPEPSAFPDSWWFRRAATSDLDFVLEVELQRQLHYPRIAGADDASEAARLPGQSYPVEVGVVEDVKCFRAELQARVLTNLCVLEKRNIPALKSRTANRATPRIPRRSRGIRRIDKRRGIEPLRKRV